MKVYVPGDSSAVSVGADEVAAALAAAGHEVVRTGSRGACWLEPLVEVDRDGTRLGFGPLAAEQAAAFTGDPADETCIGVVEALPWFAQQTRLTTARLGLADPLDPDAYLAHGGLAGLERALTLTPAGIVDEVRESGLRGRGGAGFPAGVKWETVRTASADQKYVCVNADEGDSGTFADRLIMEGDPFALLEGMAIAGIAVGASQGFIYLRSEYPHAHRALTAACEIARLRGWLGEDVLGSGHAFDVTIRLGAGSYVCGEETAMLESLEGKRGVVRAKPPLPALRGLFGKPTVINNVLTIAAVPYVLAHGAAAYAAHGVGRSLGTSLYQLAGNVARGGVVELGFGVALRELVEDFGQGTRSGRPIKAVQVGGPLGAYLPAHALDVAADYESLAAAGAMLGHGGIVVFDDTVDMVAQARFAMEFCALESCGKCTPCRVGSTRGVELIDRIRTGEDAGADTALLRDLCEVMRDGSLCAMGGLTPLPVLSALDSFAEDWGTR